MTQVLAQTGTTVSSRPAGPIARSWWHLSGAASTGSVTLSLEDVLHVGVFDIVGLQGDEVVVLSSIEERARSFEAWVNQRLQGFRELASRPGLSLPSGVDVERDIIVRMPPRSRRTVMVRTHHAGRGRPRIVVDVSTEEP